MKAGVAALLVAALLAPSALASHYTLYYTGGLRAEIGTFELNDAGAPTHGNQNGPAGEERRPVPADPDVPRRFRNLSDILTSDLSPPAGARGTLILDHQMYGSTVETGHLVPYGYYAGAATGAPRTTPTSMHALWYGWWDDVDGDGVIDDEWCAGTGLNCNATDEFVWRGANTGEGGCANVSPCALTALAYFFPGDYDGSTGSLAHAEPAGFAGSCALWRGDNVGCVSPEPDMPYADSTANAANPANQRWAGNNGGGAITAEEFLVVSQHAVSLVGASALGENSDEQFRVDCSGNDVCLRDYDWYGALAGDQVDELYLSAMRGVRNCLWMPVVEEFDLGDPDWNGFCGLPGLPPELHPLADAGWSVVTTALGLLCIGYCVHPELPEPCPQGVPSEFYGCVPDTRHLDARADGDSHLRAWTRQVFDTVVPNYQPCIGVPIPCPSFYSQDLDVERNTLAPYSTYVLPGLVRPYAEAWLWDDLSGDGYIGAPADMEVALYEAGLDNSPNGGACHVDSGGDCELIPRADVYQGAVARVSPGPMGWPPGTLVVRDYWRMPLGTLGLPGGGYVESPPPGDEPVDLRFSAEGCRGRFGCAADDAIFLPTGSALGLRGEVVGGVEVAWTEGTVAYSVRFDGVWEASV